MAVSTPTRRRKSSPAREKPVPEKKAAKAPAAAKEPHFEFGGPVGALGVMVGLPVVILVLFFGCGKEFCVTGPATAAQLPSKVWEGLKTQALWPWTAAAVVFGWCAPAARHRSQRLRSPRRPPVRVRPAAQGAASLRVLPTPSGTHRVWRQAERRQPAALLYERPPCLLALSAGVRLRRADV